MTQKELIESVHKDTTNKITFGDMVHKIANAITEEGESDLGAILARLEPATRAYLHTYPDDISDGPWQI